MTLKCTACRQPLPERDYNQSTDLAFCHHCGTEHSANHLRRLQDLDVEHFRKFTNQYTLADNPNQLLLPSKHRNWLPTIAALIVVCVSDVSIISRILENGISPRSGISLLILLSVTTLALYKAVYELIGKVRLTIEKGVFSYNVMLGSWVIKSKQIPIHASSHMAIVEYFPKPAGIQYQLEIKTDGERLRLGGYAIDDDYFKDVLLWIDVKLYKLRPKVAAEQNRSLRLSCTSCGQNISPKYYHIGNNVAYCHVCGIKHPLDRLRRFRNVDTKSFQDFVHRYCPYPNTLEIKSGNPTLLMGWIPFTLAVSSVSFLLVKKILSGDSITVLGGIVGLVFAGLTFIVWGALFYGLFGKSLLIFKNRTITFCSCIGPFPSNTKQIPLTSATTITSEDTKRKKLLQIKIRTGEKSITIPDLMIDKPETEHVLLWIDKMLCQGKPTMASPLD